MNNNKITNLNQKANDNALLLSDELKITFKNCILNSNNIINSIKNSQFDTEKENKKLYEVMENLLENLTNYDQLDLENNTKTTDKEIFIKFRRDMEINYRQLSNIYYKFMIDKMTNQTEKLQKEIKGAQSNNSKLKNEFKQLNNKMESLGATFLNIVLTISITSTMITVLLNASPKYAIAIILGCAWLLLSSILFIGIYFKNDNSNNSKMTIGIYITLSIITLLTFGYCIWTDETAKQNNETTDNTNQIIINNNESQNNEENNSTNDKQNTTENKK